MPVHATFHAKQGAKKDDKANTPQDRNQYYIS